MPSQEFAVWQAVNVPLILTIASDKTPTQSGDRCLYELGENNVVKTQHI